MGSICFLFAYIHVERWVLSLSLSLSLSSSSLSLSFFLFLLPSLTLSLSFSLFPIDLLLCYLQIYSYFHTQMLNDGHYKLAAERVMGRSAASANNMTLEKWMFVNTPATERRVLRFFRLRWNSNAVHFYFERDETGESQISVFRYMHTLTHSQIHKHTHMNILCRTHTHRNSHEHTHTQIHTHINTDTQTHTDAHRHRHMQTHIHTHTHTHANTHTHRCRSNGRHHIRRCGQICQNDV